MKSTPLLTLTALLASFSTFTQAASLGTAFTYQGCLYTPGGPASGVYDFTFQVFTNANGGVPSGPPVTNTAVAVNNGLFSTLVDFGGAPTERKDSWLQLGVRTNGSPAAAFTALLPRQPVTSTPFAWYADVAGTASNVGPGVVTGDSIAAGTVTANNIGAGQVVKSLNGLRDAVALNAGTNVTVLPGPGNSVVISVSSGLVTNLAWGLSGNAGTASNHFLGTADNRALELRVNNQRAMRLEPTSTLPNVLGGGPGNTAGGLVYGGTIGGGDNNALQGSAQASAAPTIAGGRNNTIEPYSYDAVIAGGYNNRIQYDCDRVAIGGGINNLVGTNADGAVIAGGANNTIEGLSSQAVIGGGSGNLIQYGNERVTIAGGYNNLVGTNADGAAISGGNNNAIYTAANRSFIGAGRQNYVQANAYDSVVAGGWDNQVGNGAYVGTIGGGTHNRVAGAGGTVPGGNGNEANGVNSFAAGTQAHAQHSGAFVWADGVYTDFASTAANQFLIRAAGGVGVNTTAPQAMVHIEGNSWLNWPHLRLYETEPTDFARLELQSAGKAQWHIAAGGGNNDLNFWNATNGDVVSVSQTGNMSVNALTVRGGADVAEPFPISDPHIQPGAVVVIDDQHPGQLKLSDRAYDTRVAGIVSGANGIKPGLSLHQEGAFGTGPNVALSGRVYVQADASQAPIRPGDLLTTSDTPGCAMKVADHVRAQGAILGKAMTALGEGKGLVLVLVTLQ